MPATRTTFRKGDGRPRVGGRKPGIPNQTTRDIKQAWQMLVENNTHRLEEWLAQIAEGQKTNRVIKGSDGKEHIIEVWLREPDPAKAISLMADVSEFAVPRLARTELVGDKKQPLIVQSAPMDEAL